MDGMINMIKAELFTYALEERVAEGFKEITENVAISLADTLNIPLERTRKTATKMVLLAMAQLRNDMLRDTVDTLGGVCDKEAIQ